MKVKNRFQALTKEDDNKDSEDRDRRASKTDNSHTNMNFVVCGLKLVDKKSRRRTSGRIATNDDYNNMNEFSIDCLEEVVKEEELNPMLNPRRRPAVLNTRRSQTVVVPLLTWEKESSK